MLENPLLAFALQAFQALPGLVPELRVLVVLQDALVGRACLVVVPGPALVTGGQEPKGLGRAVAFASFGEGAMPRGLERARGRGTARLRGGCGLLSLLAFCGQRGGTKGVCSLGARDS